MNPAESRWKELVDARNKWKPRGRRKPCPYCSNTTDCHQKRDKRRDRFQTDTPGHFAKRLHEALQPCHFPGGQGRKHGCGSSDINKSNDDTCCDQGSRDIAACIFDFFAHRGSAFDAPKRKRNRGQEE